MRGLRGWQFRLTGWAVAYALALHAILMLAGPLPVAQPGAAFDAAAILCLAGDHANAAQTGDTQKGGGQADHRHAAGHCVLCAGGAAPPPVQALLSTPIGTASRQTGVAIVSIAFDRRTAGRPSLPRAPPPPTA